ncbi:uncharacterized protein LOC134718051 [Mytilus trossulus]|uniref:uncharacterized protein LOC134718051 n=1 Tax=Mytilus trossulus TaxID=6551 RepID=UPI00300507C8
MKCNKQKEERLLNIISAAYIGCEDWGSQRQILSIVAHQVSYSELHALIPDLSRYKYGAARKHALSVGSGQKVPATEITHEGITTEQINHFLDFIMSPAIITDIPFGESNLKLSNGEIISVPKIILNSVRTRVVQQYFSYCEEINFEEKGSLSSYMRILHAIGPNVRKCMKGLDNYAADGAKAIESLQKIADLFGRLDKGKEWQDKMCKLLTSSKQYLKLEYKTHVVKESEVADHCCTFALSDGTKDYTSSCSHLHQNSCNQCEELDTVLECLMGVSKTITYDNDDQRDDTMYTISESVRAVHEWKKHILRSVNQDIARKSVLENLKEDEMLVERDWAMKFIPMQYRESQSNWFGKRGLNWHVSVATFKYRQALTMHTVIHIFDSAPQDAETSNAVLGNSLEIFHQINPCLTNAYIRSDNAGCFHGAASVCAMPFLSSIVQCKRMDFADPQGGKSICDRKAAHVKSYIRRYVNEGNDVCTAMDFKNALMKSNIKKVSVVVALQPPKSDSKKKEPTVFKLPKITTVNNFSFKNGGVQVWRQYGIGQGCHIPAVDMATTRDLPELTIIETYLNQQTETDVRQTETEVGQTETEVRQAGIIEAEVPLQEPETQENEIEVESLVNDSTVTTGDKPNDDVDSVTEEEMSKLFSCHECTKTFSKYGNLLRHLDIGKHSVKKENKKLSDKSKIEYSRHMEKVNTVTVNSNNFSSGNSNSDLTQGWALKIRRTVKRFTQDQKKYLQEKFDRGEKTGQKFDPDEVSQDMRMVRTTSGRKRFSQEEFLSTTQIASYFSRLVLNKRKLYNPLYTADDEQAETAEAEFIELNLVAA